MNAPPLLAALAQEAKDRDQLNLLAILYFVSAGLAFLGIGFLFLHYLLMSSIFLNPEVWKHSKDGPPPEMFFDFFLWFYVIFGALMVLLLLLNLLAGFSLRRRQNRTFTIVVAGVNCLQMPLGTLLGVFTIMVLARDSVRRLYGQAAPMARKF